MLKKLILNLKCYFYLIICFLFISPLTHANEKLAPVSGFARSFLMDSPIKNATIHILETGKEIKTDSRGYFGPILYPVGKPITLLFEKQGYQAVQSDTVIVPQEGLTNPHNNISFQVPSIETYYLFSKIIGANFDENKCHVATTIIANGKTLNDVPQGEVGAIVTLSPHVNEIPFYFDMFSKWPIKGKTNPFTRGLKQTTADGGVAFFNLPPREKPYTISAEKNGITFTKAQFLCRKGMFINISPPRGPMALLATSS